MKKTFLIVSLFTCVSTLWAYKDSADYNDGGNGGLYFAIFIFAVFILALVIGFFRDRFK